MRAPAHTLCDRPTSVAPAQFQTRVTQTKRDLPNPRPKPYPRANLVPPQRRRAPNAGDGPTGSARFAALAAAADVLARGANCEVVRELVEL